MSKRRAESSVGEQETLKSGERPVSTVNGGEDPGEFEDEFEDEFESEDETFEAGVDGRPDEEREAEERDSNSLLEISPLSRTGSNNVLYRCDGRR